jgi:pantetheine-phosphate adenylyltransferase
MTNRKQSDAGNQHGYAWADDEVEQQMAHTNFAFAGVRTVYVPCQPGLSHVSSRFIRDIAAHGGDVSSMVPAVVASALSSAQGR